MGRRLLELAQDVLGGNLEHCRVNRREITRQVSEGRNLILDATSACLSLSMWSRYIHGNGKKLIMVNLGTLKYIFCKSVNNFGKSFYQKRVRQIWKKKIKKETDVLTYVFFGGQCKILLIFEITNLPSVCYPDTSNNCLLRHCNSNLSTLALFCTRSRRSRHTFI